MDATRIRSGDSIKSGLSSMLEPASLVPALTAGATNAVLIVSLQMSFAAMLFSRELSVFVPKAIGLLLLGTIVIGVLNALKSSHPNNVSFVQDAPVAILSIPLLAIGAQMKADSATTEAVYFTAVLVVVLSTLVTGGLMMLTARFRLGNLVRYIPYPVIGGFVAGIGWLLFSGGLGVMTGLPLDMASVGSYFSPAMTVKWVPGLAFGLLLSFTLRTCNHVLIMPGMLVGAILVFFGVLFGLGIPFSQAESNGWFLGPFPEGSLWKPMDFAGFSLARWDLVFGQSMTILSVFVISSISLLLNATGLEVMSKRDIDLNKELNNTGLSNMFAAFVGSSVGFMGLCTSTLCSKISPGNRIAGIVTYVICGIVLVAGASLVACFPRALAGAVLVLVGFDMLWEWIWQSWRKLPKIDYFLLVGIFVVIATVGFLEGVGVGIVVAVILFVITYSRIDIVKSASSGGTFRSNVERAAPHRWILDRKGDGTLILRLHGFIFFGTANRLRDRIVERVGQGRENALRYVVLDFSKVNGFDSSALNSFERLRQFAQAQDIRLVLVRVSDSFREQFEKANPTGESVHYFPDLDHGLEWCENQILNIESDLSARKRGEMLESTFSDMWQALGHLDAFEQLLDRMAPFLESKSMETGQFLFRKGETIKGLYFIESGQISILLDRESGHSVRLRTAGPGSVIGEWGDCEQQGAATATSVIATKPGRVFHLTGEKLREMEKSDPELSLQLFKHLTRTLSERLCRTTGVVRDLL